MTEDPQIQEEERPFEPENSYEVSYVICLKKPHVTVGMSENKLFKKLGAETAFKLQYWANANFSQRWFKDHI
jgi:hypothetical protein